MPDVVITEFMQRQSVDVLASEYDIVYDTDLAEDIPRLRSVVSDARALVVRNRTAVDNALIAAAPNLQVIARLGVGLDNIDLVAAEKAGVVVEPATGANNVSVAEYVIGAMFNLARGVFASTHEVVGGQWPRQSLVGGELSGKTLGLLGFGAISREVARRALSLDMKVNGHDPFISDEDPVWGEVSAVSVEALLAESDFISIHIPLTDDTAGSIGAEQFEAMKDGAVLVNTSRGGIIDEQALADALRDGHLGGAVLDVFETEPLEARSARKYDGLTNLILTPHVAGVTNESEGRVGAMTVASVKRHLGGPR